MMALTAMDKLLFWSGIGAAQKGAGSKEVKPSRHPVVSFVVNNEAYANTNLEFRLLALMNKSPGRGQTYLRGVWPEGDVREAKTNDADRNSRTCFAARSARRDDCRRDVGRDRAKKAAKMNVEPRLEPSANPKLIVDWPVEALARGGLHWRPSALMGGASGLRCSLPGNIK